MIVATLPADSWKALCLVAAKKDRSRPYLQGVVLDFSTPGRCHAVATDGARMLVIDCDTEPTALEAAAGRTFIVPRELLEKVKPVARGIQVNVHITPVDDKLAAGTVTVQGAVATTGSLIDHTFPQWQRLVPDTCDGVKGDYNFHLIGDFARAAELLECKYPFLIGNSANMPALIRFHERAFALVMPMRTKTGALLEWSRPAWMSAAAPTAAEGLV